MKRQFKAATLLLTLSVIFTGCTTTPDNVISSESGGSDKPILTTSSNPLPIDFEVDPNTFEINILSEDDSISVSNANTQMAVENLVESENKTAWTYTDKNIDVSTEKMDDYLAITVASTTDSDNEMTFPLISAEKYYMPLGEGKQFADDDPVWLEYLSGYDTSVLEEWSMPFFSTIHGNKAVVYIIEDPYRNTVNYDEADTISFSISQKFVSIDDDKEKTIRVYLTDANPASVAKIYRDYVIECGNFMTLEEKAQLNPNIEKLYGAPHIYLAGSNIISPDDINWQEFIEKIDSDAMKYLLSFTDKIEVGNEMKTIISTLANQGYADKYQKNIICTYITSVLLLKDFYNPHILSVSNKTIETLQNKTDEAAYIDLNKVVLQANLSTVFAPTEDWMDNQTVDVLADMKESGIDTAWVGLHSWEQAYNKPELTTKANELGYLIGPYDSYHSIHESGKEGWITAKFQDPSLYENATIIRQNGKFVGGFQNKGRKLNPTLTLPLVNDRLSTITEAEPNFNSWFIDCDTTGEAYDDYAPNHTSTMRDDIRARLDRMSLIRDDYNMVIGSEGGNDYAASTIAFAHGIELRAFYWMDEDMRSNKESEYHQGNYYNPTGGVTPNFSKRIPLKDKFYELFVNPIYDIPLFKLVYNDSMITTYHWGNATFKFKGATQNRMLREVLYNVPPMYHLDNVEWEKYKEDIIAHNTIWSKFSRQVINKEMTDFKNLTEDGTIQLTQYGDNIKVVANFSNEAFLFEQTEIPAHGLIMDINGEIETYTPNVSDEHK